MGHFWIFAISSAAVFLHETTVTPNVSKISAGLNFKPAGNSTGHLFGHGFFRTIPRLGMVQKAQNEASANEKKE